VIFGLILYVILSYLEDTAVPRIYLEFVSFISFFFIWANFIIYKNAFLRHGFDVIWENTPSEILKTYFMNINVPDAVASIGFLPLIFGIYGVYNYIVKKKNKKILILVGMFLSSFILLWLKVLPAEVCLVYIGGSLAVLFGVFLKDFNLFIESTKFTSRKNLFFTGIVLLLLITQIVPGIIAMSNESNSSPKPEYIESFRWLKNNTENDSVILSIPEEGNLITYYGDRKNVIDTSFILIDDPGTILKDVNSIYTQKFKIEGLRLLEKYDVDYIILSENAKKKYGISEISYISSPCFYMAYKGNIIIYKLNKNSCTLKSQ
jgi:hypothetical protein